LFVVCPNYPLWRGVVALGGAELCPTPVEIVDSAAAMADQSAPHLEGQGSESKGALQCYVTDATMMESLAPRFLGETLESVELVDL
jgi:hypothetical protein